MQVTSKILLGGGCVLTLGARTPNLARADVLIEGETITEVAPGIRARDAEHVDATDTIVMPGFVDTHRHAWTSLFRNLGPGAEGGPPTTTALGEHLQPDDVYAGTLVGLLGAVEAGITTVVDWSLAGSDGTAEAALQAHADAGIRSVFVAVSADARHQSARDLLLRLAGAAGPATRVAFGSVLGAKADLEPIARAVGLARESSVRIHGHLDPDGTGPGAIAALGARGLLGADVTLVHPAELDDADADAIASSKTGISLAPSSEMASGLGTPPIQQLIDRDIRPGLGVDDERLTPGDLFAQMRATISVQHATVFDRKLAGKAGLPKLMSTRDVIRYGTVHGARVAGWGDVTGSLEPGRRADVLVLRTDRPNVFPINDPIGAVVWGMDTSNVDAVFVGGRPLLRDGVLTGEVGRARTLATAARARVADAAGLVGAAPGAPA
jgi:cytosine/adenosine deaminase-related metal-dependent hydrolase